MEILLSIRSKTDAAVREVKCPIGDGLVVGRGAEEGVLLDGPDLSREHLVLTANGANVYVTDLSSNGTWLNGTRLRRSIRSRVGVEDSIEVPGYVLRFRPADQPEKEEQAAIAQVPQPVAEASPIALPTPEPSRPVGLLGPVFQFIESFSFGEKFLVFVGLGGLLLLYTYIGS